MDEPEQNPIVALASRLRAQREIESRIDAFPAAAADGESAGLAAFGAGMQAGIKRLEAILGPRSLTFVRLEKPLRVRVRFEEKRVALDLDAARELVIVRGLDLDGEYQFDTGAAAPTLVRLPSGEFLTPSSLLKRIAQDAELPPPSRG
jgi:hypothetical protein